MSENKMKVQLTLLSTTWSLNLINHQNYIQEFTCNKVAKAVKQCSIHFLSVELWIRRYNEETKFSLSLRYIFLYKNLQWFMFLKSYLFSFFVISSYYKFSKAVYLWSRSCCRLRRKSGEVQMVDETKIMKIMMLIKSYSVKKKKVKSSLCSR